MLIPVPRQAEHPGGSAARAGQAAGGLQHPVLAEHVSVPSVCPLHPLCVPSTPSVCPLHSPHPDLAVPAPRVSAVGQPWGVPRAPDAVPVPNPVPRASSHIQSYFSGAVVGESAMKQEQDVGSALTFDFQVS